MGSKNYKLVTTLFLLASVTLCCSQEDIDIDLNSTKWEVVKIKKDNESPFFKAENS